MVQNQSIERLPRHLHGWITERPYDSYTSQDQAIWRYVMRQNVDFLRSAAHPAYLEGLRKTGISIERIPDMTTMNSILGRIGWGAVTVDGFIPPAAFMEFQAYRVLVIAADIRPIGQIEYTPAPDILHEAAGHAPIIADESYAAYLQRFGEIGSKAFSSASDYELYEAIRHLSILKADPRSPAEKIFLAEKTLEAKERSLGVASEMASLRNLHWWTVEYGLVGTVEKPLIYGAGLLSSIGESANALSKAVKKIPYSIDAVYYNFDITRQQPQLFVTPDFDWLGKVLDDFADRMALRKGGVEGMLKAVDSGWPATAVYSSGLQVSGLFSDCLILQNQPAYIQTTGPTLLSYANEPLQGHLPDQHAHGFGAPVGRIKGLLKPPRYMDKADMQNLGIVEGKKCSFEFESSVRVEGELFSELRKEDKLLMLSFRNCKVSHQDRILFEPSWGTYDMAVGEALTSVFSGPANADAFGLSYPKPLEKTHAIEHNDHERKLHQLYRQLRQMRESTSRPHELMKGFSPSLTTYPDEWLLWLEAVELAIQLSDHSLADQLTDGLRAISKRQPSLEKLIYRGLRLLGI